MRKIALPLILFIAVISWGLFPGCSLTDTKEEEGMWNTPGIPPPTLQSFPRWHPTQDKILYYNHGVVKYDPDQNRTIQEADSTGLWMMNADGSGKRKLLDGQSIYADWSPSGDSIVFERGAQIYKVRFNGETIDTASIQQLTFEGRNFFPDWNPEGESVSYDSNLDSPSGLNFVWKMKTNGSEKTRITHTPDEGETRMPSWSPDGHKIVHIRFLVGVFSSEIYSMNSNGDNFNRLTENDRLDSYPQYSPTGLKIAFQSNNQVWVMDADGSNQKQLYPNGGMPDWSPEGNQIVFIGPKTTIWVMNADGTNPRQLTVRPEGEITEE